MTKLVRSKKLKIMKLKSTFFMLLFSIISFNAAAQDSGNFKLDEVYNMGSNGTLHLRSEDADVKITGTDRSDVHVYIERNEEVKGMSSARGRFDVDVEERDGDLFIRERKPNARFTMGYYRLDYEITIEMPKTGSLRIQGEDDDYIIKSVNGAISIETEDGNVDLVECMGDDFEIELEDGDLRMDGGNGSLYVNVEDGDADIRNGNFKDIEIRSEDGDVLIETSLSNAGKYDFSGDDASIELVVLSGGGDFDISKDDGRVTASSAFDLIHESDYRVEYKLPSGEADVRIRTNDGRVRLSKK